MPQKQPNYTWDPVKRRYRDKRGHLVRLAVILAWVKRATEKAKKDFLKLAQRLIDGEITDREFQVEMGRRISASHRAMAVIAAGGLLALTGPMRRRLADLVTMQLAYFLRFASQIQQGRVTPAQIANRASMYGDALYSTYQNLVTAREEGGGARYARRIAKMDDGTCEGCGDQHRKGWQKIEDILPIGDAECLSNCRCVIEYLDDLIAPPKPPEAIPPPPGGQLEHGPGFHIRIE